MRFCKTLRAYTAFILTLGMIVGSFNIVHAADFDWPEVTLEVTSATAQKDEVIDVTVSMGALEIPITSVLLSVHWDTAALEYQGFTRELQNGMDFMNDQYTSEGYVKYIWESMNPIESDTSIIHLQFKVLADPGTTEIYIGDDFELIYSYTPEGAVEPNLDFVGATLIPGTVTIVEPGSSESTSEETSSESTTAQIDSSETTTAESSSESTTGAAESSTETTTDAGATSESTTELSTEDTSESTTANAETSTQTTTAKPATEAPTETTTKTAPEWTETTTRTSSSGSHSSGGGGGGRGPVKEQALAALGKVTTEKSTEETTGDGEETTKTSSEKTTEGTTAAVVEESSETTTMEIVMQLPEAVQVQVGSNIMMIGQNQYTLDEPAFIQEGTDSTLIPFRAVSLALAGSPDNPNESSLISWEPNTKTASIVAGDKLIEFRAGKPIMLVNGQRTDISNYATPEIRNGRLFIPFRALADAFGVNCQWDEVTRTVTFN